jgi:AcrR family transcriptional regulator
MTKKDAILKSVLKLVNRAGFYHLNMKDIAKEANVAAGTIYLHFKGKEELINALYQMVVSDFNKNVIHGYNSDLPLKDNFYRMLENAINFFLEDTDRFSFIEQYTYSPFIFKESYEENYVILHPIYQMMADAKKLKLIKNLNEAILVSLVYGPVTMMLKLHLAHKAELDNILTKQKLIEACWNNIALHTNLPTSVKKTQTITNGKTKPPKSSITNHQFTKSPTL